MVVVFSNKGEGSLAAAANIVVGTELGYSLTERLDDGVFQFLDPGPAKRRILDKEIRAVRVELAKLEQTYGAAAMDNPEIEWSTRTSLRKKRAT